MAQKSGDSSNTQSFGLKATRYNQEAPVEQYGHEGMRNKLIAMSKARASQSIVPGILKGIRRGTNS